MGRLQELILQGKRGDGRFPLEELLRDLEELGRFEGGERARFRRAKWIVGLLVVVGILLIITDPVAPGLAIGLGATMVAAGVAIWFKARRRWRERGLMEDFQGLLLPFLREVAEDLDPKRPVELELDLAGPVEGKRERQWQEKRGGHTFVFTLFRDPWLRLRARLRDGNLMELSCTNNWLRRVRSYKKKTKWKKEAVVKAAVIARNPALKWREAGDRDGGFRFDPSKRGGRLSLVRKFKFKGPDAPPLDVPPVEEVVAMFMEIYRRCQVEEGEGHGS